MKYYIIPTFVLLFLLGGCFSEDTVDFDNTADLEFLEEYAGHDDVIITQSGLLYRVIEEGEGDTPESDSRVITHYIVSLVNGTVLQNTFERDEPFEFEFDQVIDGLAEGVMLMQEGAIYELVIPADLAYGNLPPPNSNIHLGATLIFEVELLEIL